MLRYAGMALALAACTALGACMGSSLSERARSLRELERLAAMLQREIQYAATPLQEAFGALAMSSYGAFRQFFAQTARAMERRQGGTLADFFGQSAELLLQGTGLVREDVQRLVRLGERLGHADAGMQVRMLAFYQEELAQTRAQAEEECCRKAHVYRYLGFLGGCFLVLLLL